jgi:serine protease Do
LITGIAGGPLLNLKGEVIGINTAILSPTGSWVGIAFAVPSNLARNVITQLKIFGEVRRGWLGVRVQNVTDKVASTLGMTNTTGALVVTVTPDSPAERGGIEPGDVILTFDGNDVTNARTLARLVAATELGKPVAVQIQRGGQMRTLQITITRAP